MSGQKAKTTFATARGEAERFRGQVIGQFAAVERAVTLVLIWGLAQDAKSEKALPHLVGQKMKRLVELLERPGPLKDQREDIAPLVARIEAYSNLRNFMAHGDCDVALTEGGDAMAVFSMILAREGAPVAATLALKKPEMQSLSSRLTRDARALVEALAPLGKSLHARDVAIVPGGIAHEITSSGSSAPSPSSRP